jgi:hypothetical protein
LKKFLALVPFLVLVALIVVVGLSIIAAYAYLGNLYCPADMSAHNHSWLTKFSCEAKAADAALVLFTYGLMVATCWLAWATLKLWAAGEHATEVANRAWVFAGARGYVARAEEGDVRIFFETFNYGNAPAIVRELWVKSSEQAPTRNIRDEMGGDSFLDTFFLGRPIAKVDNHPHPAIVTIEPGKRFIMGFIRYGDVFSAEGRKTWFCYELRPTD